MKMSGGGLNLLKDFEGLRLKAYLDPVGIWTVGYGHTSAAGAPVVTSDLAITKSEAVEILKRDLTQYEDGVRKLVKVELTQGQFDALVDFAYNAGVGALAKSTLLKRVNAGKFNEVPAEFMKWTKGGGRELPGLVRRRRAEAKLWRGLDTDAPVVVDESRVEPDQPKASKSITQSREANAAVVAGGLSTIAIAQETIPLIRDGSSLISSLSPTILIFVVIIAAAAIIWYLRKQRLDEEGA